MVWNNEYYFALIVSVKLFSIYSMHNFLSSHKLISSHGYIIWVMSILIRTHKNHVEASVNVLCTPTSTFLVTMRSKKKKKTHFHCRQKQDNKDNSYFILIISDFVFWAVRLIIRIIIQSIMFIIHSRYNTFNTHTYMIYWILYNMAF